MVMIIMFIIPIIVYFIYKKLTASPKLISINRKHVVITGGSSGIGKCVAMLCAKKGANVTIIARDPAKLALAKKEIEKYTIHRKQEVNTVSLDVSVKTQVVDCFDKLEQHIGPIAMLVNCAGMAFCGTVEQFSEDDVNSLINTNYLGTLFPIQCVVARMKQRKEGVIVLTGSGVSLMGMYGYSVYSSCKFAIRGLAESISMELKPYNISVTLALPPDTDTPGFEEENKTKPEETKLISASGGILDPEVVATKMLHDALRGNFFSFVGFESYILSTLCVGMTPCMNFFQLLMQVIILGPLRLFGAYYARKFDGIVKTCFNAKNQ